MVDMTCPNSRTHKTNVDEHRYYPYDATAPYDSYKTPEYDLYEVPPHDEAGSDPLPSRIAARATYNLIALADDIENPVRRALLSLVEDWLLTGIDVGSWIDVRKLIAHYVPETHTYTERAEPL